MRSSDLQVTGFRRAKMMPHFKYEQFNILQYLFRSFIASNISLSLLFCLIVSLSLCELVFGLSSVTRYGNKHLEPTLAIFHAVGQMFSVVWKWHGQILNQ